MRCLLCGAEDAACGHPYTGKPFDLESAHSASSRRGDDVIRVVDPVGNEFLYSQADIEEQGLFRRGWRRKWEDKDDLRPSPAGSAGSQQKAMEDAMAARETRNARIHGADTAVASDIDELKRQIAELRSLLEAKPSEPATDSAPDFEKLTLEQLHAYATEHNVDLEGATLKSDVVAKLKAASA